MLATNNNVVRRIGLYKHKAQGSTNCDFFSLFEGRDVLRAKFIYASCSHQIHLVDVKDGLQGRTLEVGGVVSISLHRFKLPSLCFIWTYIKAWTYYANPIVSEDEPRNENHNLDTKDRRFWTPLNTALLRSRTAGKEYHRVDESTKLIDTVLCECMYWMYLIPVV